MVHSCVMVDDEDMHIKKQLISNTNVTLGCLCRCLQQVAVSDKSFHTSSKMRFDPGWAMPQGLFVKLRNMFLFFCTTVSSIISYRFYLYCDDIVTGHGLGVFSFIFSLVYRTLISLAPCFCFCLC